MEQTIIQKESNKDNSINFNKLIGILSVVFLSMVSLTIFQDYLQANRSGYSFYFGESILFKNVWFLFILFLPLIYRMLQNENFKKAYQITFLILLGISIHIIINSFTIWTYSILFYDGVYDLYKTFTYTLANDLDKLVSVYCIFIFGFKYLSTKINYRIYSKETIWLNNIIISSGKNNRIININDVFQITAATPYISIWLENKKYLHTGTLKSISGNLNPNSFVRIHKSTIVNVEKVVSFKSRLNGDYDILLANGDKLRLSRTFVSGFRKVFIPTHRVSQ